MAFVAHAQISAPEELVGFKPSEEASAKLSCGKWAFVSRAVALAEKLQKSAVDEALPVVRDVYSDIDWAACGRTRKSTFGCCCTEVHIRLLLYYRVAHHKDGAFHSAHALRSGEAACYDVARATGTKHR